MNLKLAVGDGNFSYLRVEAAETIHDRDSPESSGRQWLAPPGFFSGKVQHSQKACPSRSRQQFSAELHRIFSACGRDLVDERFHEECVLRMSYRAPEVRRNIDARFMIMNKNIRNGIQRVGHSGDAFAIDTILHLSLIHI